MSMNFVVKSKEEISKSPVNLSKSKQLFSFPKAESFSGTFFYNIPDYKTTRAASIGRGNKFDFTKNAKGPNPQIYDKGTDFDMAHPHSPKWSFGLGRDHFSKVYYETNKMIDKDVPGPGKYDCLKNFGSQAAKYTMRAKPDIKGLETKILSPGPGDYSNNVQTNKEGKYPISQFKNTVQIIFGANKTDRFVYDSITYYLILASKFPGPQKYNIEPLINGNGKSNISKFRSSPGITIAGRYDIKLKNSCIKYLINLDPGPGTYNQFSEWGVYQTQTPISSPVENTSS